MIKNARLYSCVTIHMIQPHSNDGVHSHHALYDAFQRWHEVRCVDALGQPRLHVTRKYDPASLSNAGTNFTRESRPARSSMFVHNSKTKQFMERVMATLFSSPTPVNVEMGM